MSVSNRHSDCRSENTREGEPDWHLGNENSLRPGGHATRRGNHAAMMKRTVIEPVTARVAENQQGAGRL
jgi:hypothetical protein